MSFRCFERVAWRKNSSWPHGYEPQAVPMDECETVAEFDSREEAVEFCTEHNDEREHEYESPFYEWTEE